jgi:hypothetical protein
MLFTGLIVFSLTSCVKDDTPDTYYLPTTVKSITSSSYGATIHTFNISYDLNHRIESIYHSYMGTLTLTYNSDDSPNTITSSKKGTYKVEYAAGRVVGLSYNGNIERPIGYNNKTYSINNETYQLNSNDDIENLYGEFLLTYSKDAGPFRYVNMDESVLAVLIGFLEPYYMELNYLSSRELLKFEFINGNDYLSYTNYRGENGMIHSVERFYNSTSGTPDRTFEYTYSEVQN